MDSKCLLKLLCIEATPSRRDFRHKVIDLETYTFDSASGMRQSGRVTLFAESMMQDLTMCGQC